MNKIKMLVVESNVMLKDLLVEYFNNSDNILLKYIASDGEEASDILKKYHNDIDIVILDLFLPKKDGISVLEAMNENKINKKVIVTSAIDTYDIIQQVSRLGASYFLFKPYDLKDLEKRILLLSEMSDPDMSKVTDFYDTELKNTITKMLHELGIPSHIKGYQYIREGITILYHDYNMIGAITKKLYPELAKRYKTTTSRVERAMRHAIEVGWTRSDWKMTEDLFGQSVDFDRAKPTNSEFLVTIADKLRLDSRKVFV